MLTTCFLSSSHFSSMMLDRFQSEIHHLHYCMTIYRISPEELRQRRLPSAFDPERTAGIICFEVFDYEIRPDALRAGHPAAVCGLPVTELKAPLKADLLYMDNHVEILHFIQIMHQRAGTASALSARSGTASPFSSGMPPMPAPWPSWAWPAA